MLTGMIGVASASSTPTTQLAGKITARIDGRRQARGDRPPLVVVEVITQPRELFGDRRDGRARAHLLVRGVTQDERGQDRVAGASLGAAGTRRGQPVRGERPGRPQEAARHHAEDVAAGRRQPGRGRPRCRRLRPRSAPRYTSSG